ncbi:hypothetical protein Vretimale_5221 [Volvox reticuliferus]|uniref:Uncharacterized protein n=1 Tax=Volvox reticuliferus TaxID=1737510 RepID=A0A8J4C1C6_9CHLO|nr:hypothetical protein Vretifemale_3655 [Volvox reticuliferus]GIM00454.1 hypothetical protein Vretimale_5221 [Volvox reticuliferus]
MAAPWEPARLGTSYSFGRPFVDKPSFDGLPSESVRLAQASLLAADRAAADWERVEFLFERNWFGPCACLRRMWSLEEPGDFLDLDANPTDTQTRSVSYATGPFLCLFGAFQPQPKPKPQSASHLIQPVSSSVSDQAVLYGVATAPVPEPAFVSNDTAQDLSPRKAVPVPMRTAGSTKEKGDAGPFPPAAATDPSEGTVPVPAEPLPAQPTALARAAAKDPAIDPLGPQLGTWADRQYRLLDPVPERSEFGPGSTSGNSAYSPSTRPLNGGAAGSGGCGSGSGGSSSVQTLSRCQTASPSLLDPLHKQKQEHQHSHPNHDVQKYALQDGRGQGQEYEDRDVAQQLQRTAPIDAAVKQIDTEAQIQEAAWRWRFTRRWQAEQARTEPDQASSAPRDQMEEALAYLQATNATTTVSMQIANVSSRGSGSRISSSRGGVSMDGSLPLTGTVGTLGAAASTLGGDWPLAACGSGSGSFTSGPRILGRQTSGELLAASREVASMNRRAAAVLQQQLDCELEADRRIQKSLGQGPPWVGTYIPIVQIDEWGSFRFLMLKLRDQLARGGAAPGTERQRILIRGHNYGSEGQLMEECSREIMNLAQKHELPFEVPTCMGGGVMEWRRDRDRHLHLHSGFVMDRALPLPLPLAAGALIAGNGNRPASAIDLLNLAAALARQSFPPTYKVTVQG